MDIVGRSIEIIQSEGLVGFVKAVGRFVYYHPIGEIVANTLYEIYGRFRPVVVKNVLGSKMELRLSDYGICRNLFFHKVWEKESTMIYMNMLESQDVVFDIGSNIGYYALLASRYTKKVYAFEPDPRNFPGLKKNIELNNCINIEPYNLAVSDRESEIDFLIDSEYCNRSRIATSTQKNQKAQTIKVKAISVDDFVSKKGINSVDVIRSDVEGYEYFIIKGAKKTIKKHKPKMFLEIHPQLIREYGGDVEEFLNTLKDYRVKYLVKKDFSFLRGVVYPFGGPYKNRLRVFKLNCTIDELLDSKLRDIVLNTEAYHLFLEGD